MKALIGYHAGQDLAEVVKSVLNGWGIADKWGVAVADNASNNDTCIEALVTQLCPRESVESKRGRCLAHIINLGAQAFIYSRNKEGFVVEGEGVANLTRRDDKAAQREIRL